MLRTFGNGFSKCFSTSIPKYTKVEHIVPKAKLAMASTTHDKFAVISLGCTQYKVTTGDIIHAEKVKEAKVGEMMDIKDVMLIGSRDETIIGRPYVENAHVQVRVEEQTLDKKVIVFKMKRRKNYRRKQGHRREVTLLRVTDIVSNSE